MASDADIRRVQDTLTGMLAKRWADEGISAAEYEARRGRLTAAGVMDERTRLISAAYLARTVSGIGRLARGASRGRGGDGPAGDRREDRAHRRRGRGGCPEGLSGGRSRPTGEETPKGCRSSR